MCRSRKSVYNVGRTGHNGNDVIYAVLVERQFYDVKVKENSFACYISVRLVLGNIIAFVITSPARLRKVVRVCKSEQYYSSIERTLFCIECSQICDVVFIHKQSLRYAVVVGNQVIRFHFIDGRDVLIVTACLRPRKTIVPELIPPRVIGVVTHKIERVSKVNGFVIMSHLTSFINVTLKQILAYLSAVAVNISVAEFVGISIDIFGNSVGCNVARNGF